jgi:hypothetical protein
MHCDVESNGIVGPHFRARRENSSLNMYGLQTDIESVAHYRQESLKVAAARFETLSLFCHALMA